MTTAPGGCRLPASALAVILALTLAGAARADHADWRPDPVSRLAAMEAALVPVNLRLRDNVAALQTTAGAPGLHDLDAYVGNVRAVWEEMQAIAIDGLAVLDAHPPEPCFGDLWGVYRVGFLKLGESTAEFPGGGASFTLARDLLLGGLGPSYVDLVRSVTTC